MKNFMSTLRQDIPAGLVVFLVALPLCLGISLASTKVEGVAGLPNLFSGIIAGIIGGVIVGSISGSRIGVSGPAAGLIMIVSTAIVSIGSFEGFLVAVVLAGIIQLISGFLGAGIIGNYFPSSVIKGMLAAIGLTLILKEIPHFVGYDKDFLGDEAFFQINNQNTFSDLLNMLNYVDPGVIIVSVCSLLILILFERPFIKKYSIFKFVPGALIAVLFGTLLNEIFKAFVPDLYITSKHLVSLPVPENISEIKTLFTFPDFSFLTNSKIYIIAFTIAIVGSLESLLSVEATDKLDPEKHHTPTNRELKAQGIGNIVSGLIGGLPITQVIVRSSANINSGGKSKVSTIFHGILLFVTVIFIPHLLNLIPLATLAAILLLVGYKLSKITLYKYMYSQGMEQFLPFIFTILGVLFTDLLRGIGIGMAVAIFFILKKNFKNDYTKKLVKNDKHSIVIMLAEEVSFLNKGSIQKTLHQVPRDSTVTIDGSHCKDIDHDVLEAIQEYTEHLAKEKNITIKTINIPHINLDESH